MSKIEPRFPMWVDSTALSAFKACEQKGYWQNVLRLTSSEPNPHFNAGGAYASAQETIRNLIYGRDRVPVEDAVAVGIYALIKEYGDFDPDSDSPPSVQAKTWLGMCDAIIRYYDRWSPTMDWFMPDMLPSRDPEGNDFLIPSHEFSFAIPLDIAHPETGDPILFTGRADMKVRLGGSGCWPEFQNLEAANEHMDALRGWPLYVQDDKTTYQMGGTWAKQWTYRGQFIGYVWANNELAHEPYERAHGAVVCGAGIQKTITKTDRAIVEIPQWKIDDWYDSTMYRLKQMIDCWRQGKWAKQWDDSCTSYGGCEFAQLCNTPNPAPWLANYVESGWNPVPSPAKED
jgi:hypothetical protein